MLPVIEQTVACPTVIMIIFAYVHQIASYWKCFIAEHCLVIPFHMSCTMMCALFQLPNGWDIVDLTKKGKPSPSQMIITTVNYLNKAKQLHVSILYSSLDLW